MEKKRISPMQLFAGIVFALLTCEASYRFVRSGIAIVFTLLLDYATFWSVIQNLGSAFVILLMVVGYLALAVACFLRAPKKIALCGVAVLIVSIILNSIVASMDDVVRIFQYGLRFDAYNILGFLFHQFHLLLRLLVFAAAALALLMKKPNKLLCFVPSVLAVICRVWFVIYNIIMLLVGYTMSHWLSALMSIVTSAASIVAILEAVGFALLLSTTAKEKAAGLAEPQVVEEASVQEEIPAAAE